MGVHFLLHRPLRRYRQCVEVPGAGLQERRRLLPHPLLRHPTADREAHVLPRARPRPVLAGEKISTYSNYNKYDIVIIHGGIRYVHIS